MIPSFSRNCKAIYSTLPIGLNRISWKRYKNQDQSKQKVKSTLPIGLNRISWKHIGPVEILEVEAALPIGLNRISWKLQCLDEYKRKKKNPTDWVKSD